MQLKPGSDHGEGLVPRTRRDDVPRASEFDLLTQPA